MPLYTRSLDEDHPETYFANDLWRLFIFAELAEVMRERGGKHFIDMLNKIVLGM